MTNKYTGEIPLKIGEKNGILVFDWRALAAIKSKFSHEQLGLLTEQSPAVLAEMLVMGFQKHSKDITFDDVMDASPAIAEMVAAIDTALLFAYQGPETARKVLEKAEEIQEILDEDSKKKPKKTK